jgi:hypothetical protein
MKMKKKTKISRCPIANQKDEDAGTTLLFDPALVGEGLGSLPPIGDGEAEVAEAEGAFLLFDEGADAADGGFEVGDILGKLAEVLRERGFLDVRAGGETQGPDWKFVSIAGDAVEDFPQLFQGSSGSTASGLGVRKHSWKGRQHRVHGVQVNTYFLRV